MGRYDGQINRPINTAYRDGTASSNRQTASSQRIRVGRGRLLQSISSLPVPQCRCSEASPLLSDRCSSSLCSVVNVVEGIALLSHGLTVVGKAGPCVVTGTDDQRHQSRQAACDRSRSPDLATPYSI
ncbi:hypothetical protein GJAV_G00237420 [Gymnothorax javanicus]|nr:hypothetical protein GJAV_G00237420 [Gymnothorax javanicus]